MRRKPIHNRGREPWVNPTSPDNRNARRLGLEQLEVRQLLAIDYVGGILTVTGTPQDDVVSVTQDGTTLSVNDNGVVTNYNSLGVQQLTVHGLEGKDRLTLGFGVLGATLDGGPGDDILTGGTGNDTLLGGDGDDELYGREGNDTLDGGAGFDKLYGEGGDDSILSRDGANDIISGGFGHDAATFDSLDDASDSEVWNPFTAAPDNQRQTVRVLVLNFDPLVPSEQDRHLWEIFGWHNPEEMAMGYEAAMERASGGFIDFQVVEWRNLNEIPAQVDGYRYTPDQYVQNRRTNTGWHDGGGADYPRIMADQNVVPLVDSGQVDEVWMFEDHYFGFWESAMAGPGSFYINGGVYPQVPSSRPFAVMGFSYERAVAEMMHDTGHRTEASLSRAFGGWDFVNPVTSWDKFASDAGETANGSAGVGTAHWPANAEFGYDYDNPRVVQSTADDFLNYPKLTGATGPISRTAWSKGANPDYQQDYFEWFFGHLPRAVGVDSDLRQNNWWKYIYDFDNYSPGTGNAKPIVVTAVAKDLFNLGATTYEFDVTYGSPVPIDVDTLGTGDVRVTGPNGFDQLATFVGVQDATATTHLVARYRIDAPAGTWGESDLGTYTISLRAGEVRDVLGTTAAPASVKNFAVRDTTGGDLGILALDHGPTSLAIGDHLQLQAQPVNDPNQRVTEQVIWTTSDVRIVTVGQDGMVYAVGAGSANITATLGTLQASVSLTITDSHRPVAVLTSAPSVFARTNGYQFDVTYTDDSGINLGSLDQRDIRITSPHGFSHFARLIGTNGSSDGTSVTATYGFVPDGGYWDPSEDGTYAIEVKGGQVADNDRKFVADAILGHFTVVAPPFVLCDTDGNGQVSPRDAVLVINDLLRNGTHPVQPDADAAQSPFPYLDVNYDGVVSPLDALAVINRLLDGVSVVIVDQAPPQAQAVGRQVANDPHVPGSLTALDAPVMPSISTQASATQPAVLAAVEPAAPSGQVPALTSGPAQSTVQPTAPSARCKLQPAAADAVFASLGDAQDWDLFSDSLDGPASRRL